MSQHAAASILLALLLAACQTAPPRAPVTERNPPRDKAVARAATPAPSSGLYTVQKGDSLYSIAVEHGLDYRELAAMNNMTPAAVIRVGQQLRVKKSEPVAEPVVAEGDATTTPLAALPPVVGAAIWAEGQPAPVAPAPAPAPSGAVKSEPKAIKVPFSDQVLAELNTVEPRPQPEVLPPMVVKIDPRPETAAPPEDGEDSVDWGWPAQGKILAPFSENAKGVDISGKAGQRVLATAAGKVVYSGSGLRGYGKLIIIKHNKTYLSAYAHNKEMLVKEGDSVTKGQKIAEMGNSDSSEVKLHFEIRKLGKPVDPLRYLPPEKAS
ncbi:MAG TPA: peptidoglycan DD-metalloendopeptidase family protein [Burkholderiales bacterium]|nr:peptidoglycan DD-metalloendopeptidase family protein [Burkholderiales bacterium]